MAGQFVHDHAADAVAAPAEHASGVAEEPGGAGDHQRAEGDSEPVRHEGHGVLGLAALDRGALAFPARGDGCATAAAPPLDVLDGEEPDADSETGAAEGGAGHAAELGCEGDHAVTPVMT
ncbi:hypothetical protein ACFY1A_20935 [Streptomyces sp. NPDC001520]|uniref:hypothetical protein n=1 Tax=Streptomyces sp. NPDC001520 TaxID=3364581 RepID=UPI0036B425B9